MKRREFPAKVKVAAFERAKGRCEGAGCGAVLSVGKFHYDHAIPDGLGGEPTLDNCQVLCHACHADKTRHSDVPRIAKAKRQQYRHSGARAPGKRPIPGSKRTPWRKKLNGTTERREP